MALENCPVQISSIKAASRVEFSKGKENSRTILRILSTKEISLMGRKMDRES
jgi:hypothetical protein